MNTVDHKSLYTQMISVVDKLDDLYYNDGTSPLTDRQYDLLLDSIQVHFSEICDTSQKAIGFVPNKGNAVQLPHFMASMNKFKTAAEITRWAKRFGSPYTVTAKLDGISGLYHDNKLYTRGNGKFGRDISFLLPFLKLPKNFDFASNLNNNFALRGELIIKKSVFESKYKDKFANARNLVCGLLNRNFSDEYIDMYTDLDFIVYDLYHFNPLQFCHKINMITGSYIDFVLYKNNIHDINVNNLDYILNSWKECYDYEIDGIIVTNDKPSIHSQDSNPDFAFAYKNNVIGVEIKIGVVERVIWNISKDNYLKPKIKLEESICCNGSNIEYVTGFNAKYILRNQIKPGTQLRIGLSGNVIPYIFEVVDVDLDESLDVMNLSFDCPIIKEIFNGIKCESYYWNKNKVDLISNDKSDPYVKIKQNIIFFNTFGLKCSLQETTLKNVYESLGLFHLNEILSLNEEQWSQVEKVASKKAKKIISGVHNILDWNLLTKDKNDIEIETMSYDYLLCHLSGLSCFTRGFAKKKIECHLEYLMRLSSMGKIDISQLYNSDYVKSLYNVLVYCVDVFKVNQVTVDSIKRFSEGFIRFISTYDKLCQDVKNITFFEIGELIVNAFASLAKQKYYSNSIVTSENSEIIDVGDSNNLNIVFSGIRDKTKEIEFINNGYSISDVVNSKTHMLIVKDYNSISGKVKKAKKMGIKITTLEQYFGTSV